MDNRAFLKTCLVVGLVLILASGLTACGRKGPMETPEGSTYPKDYPTE